VRFKIDENLPIEVGIELRNDGYDATTVNEQGMQGAADEDISKICCLEDRVLITLDLGFADIRSYPPLDYPGLIVLRLIQQDKQKVLNVIGRIIPLLQKETIKHRLWIVEEHRIRIR